MRRMPGVPYVDLSNLDAWGKCDRTGLPTMYRDLVPQMEYDGDSLRWTGLMVNIKDLDKPNPQLANPPLKADPLPVNNPRHFFQPKGTDVPTRLTATEITKSSMKVSWNPVEEATNYAVSWTVVGQGGWQSTLPLIDPSAMKTTSYTIEGISSKTAYIVRVASINEVVTSGGTPPLIYNMSAWSAGNQALYISTV